MAQAVSRHRKTAVKGGHSTGKTHTSGALLPWFLRCFDRAIVVTTAPSGEQVRNETWREMRRQLAGAGDTLDAKGLLPKESFWHVSDESYAQGLSTDKGERFRGKHSPNMLFIIEEAQGVPAWALEEIDHMCTAPNNRILVMGNPIEPTGWFTALFSDSDWEHITLSCLDHPNVLHSRDIYPGAVSKRWVEERIRKQCRPLEPGEEITEIDFEYPAGSGNWYRPGPLFQGRVLGEFPSEGEDTIIPLRRINRATDPANAIPIDETAPVDLGMDVAYRGGDHCVVFARRGPCVLRRWKWQGMKLDKCTDKIVEIANGYAAEGLHVGTIAIDAIGIGAGVAHDLQRMQDDRLFQCDNVLAIQVSERATDAQQYENKRAELAFALAARFENGPIDLSRLGADVDDFANEAPAIKRQYGQRLRLKISSKDDIRKELGHSCDDLDAMVLCFVDTVDNFADAYAKVMSAA